VTTTPAWTSSARSTVTAPSRSSTGSRAQTFLEYAVEAACGTVAGSRPAPITVTPPGLTTVDSGTEPATLPPCGPDARSTTTEPGRSAASAVADTSSGGRVPGTCAVVITTSKRAIAASSASCWARASAAVSRRAYPPAPVASGPGRFSTAAPSDAISDRAAARTSYPVTSAPSRRAVATA
jgi:hypothetical protein